MSQLDDLTREFLVESHERLDQLDRDLPMLERGPTDGELVARIFRAIHTLKGTGGALGLRQLEAISHAGEDLLALIRDGVIAPTPERVDALLRLVDAIRAILERIERTGAEGDADHAPLVTELTRLEGEVDAAPKNMGDHLVGRGLVTPDEVRQAAGRQMAGDPRHIGEILVELARVPPSAIAEVLVAQAREADPPRPAAGDATVRVEVEQLRRLTRLVADLGAARDEIRRHLAGSVAGPLKVALGRLDFVAAELRAGIHAAWRQPIGTVWSRLPRLIRDLAAKSGKRIRLEAEGGEVALDTATIEALRGPLTHLIRNCADHGIESPATRIGRGKAAEGLILVRAERGDRGVTIEIADDGAGIDLAKVRRAAAHAGIVAPERAARLDDGEALALIFAAGLTTAEEVTSVSGRGVGLDAVRTDVERIGGAVEVASVLGRGTTFTLRIPVPSEPPTGP